MDLNKPMREYDEHRDPKELLDEVLIGRLVDGEADPDDQDRFEQLAGDHPELWRTLALRQRDMRLLAEQVDRETACAEHIELHGWRVMPRHITWPLALSGWAAVLVVAMTWTVVVVSGSSNPDSAPILRVPVPAAASQLSPEEHLQQYQELANALINELQAILLDFKPQDDGSLQLSYMRRFHETITIDAQDARDLLSAMESDEGISPDMLNRLLEQHRKQAPPENETDPGVS